MLHTDESTHEIVVGFPQLSSTLTPLCGYEICYQTAAQLSLILAVNHRDFH